MRKLSEIRGMEAMEITADLISIGNMVLKDESLKKYYSGKKPKDVSKSEWNNDYAADLCQAMLVRHPKECASLLAEIDGKSEKEYLENLDPAKTISDLNEVMDDNQFKDLFFSCAPRRTTSSGSASENTEGRKE